MERIKVLLADDHQILREGIQSMLSHDPSIELVGQASSGKELLELLTHTPADVVLMDLNMPDMDGLETTEHLTKHFPTVKVLMLSMVSSDKIVSRLLEAGAVGYITKNAGAQEVLYAIGQVAAGKPHLGSDITFNVLKRQGPQAVQYCEGPGHARVDLSKREMEVLELIADGYSNQQIADKLFVSKRTIDSHRQNLMDKTRAKNTAALIKYVLGKGIIS